MTPPPAMSIVRVGVALLLGIHGGYRALSGGAWPFGEYLSSQGFPFGTALAWAITVFEIGGSILLGWGRHLRLVVPGFLLILVSGIAMVHARNGWFVVGAGRNGVEFSVLLLVCLAAILLDTRSRRD